MDDAYNTIKQGDCVSAMNGLSAGSVDLVFADPPFNIGYDYDVYEDSVEHQQYIDWSVNWISAVWRVLRSNGTFWLAIGDDYAAELKLESQKVGFHCRSWVIWYYTFGVNCKRKFTRSHTHLFHFVKDRNDFTFRDELDTRIPSARELVYNDKRANSRGRFPDDTWITRPADAVGELIGDDEESWSLPLLNPPTDKDRTYTLRPQDLDQSFKPSEDTWYFPRVAGTFKERAGFHGCQMPEQLLGRIIRTCSHSGDLVLDPFSGSATTLAVAKKLGRRFIGFDISKIYVQYGRERLKKIRLGDRLDGSPEPMKSAPRTAQGGKRRGRPKISQSLTPLQNDLDLQEKEYDKILIKKTKKGIREAFLATYDGSIGTRSKLNPEFIATCELLGLAGDERTWGLMLQDLRREGVLAEIHDTVLLGVKEAFQSVHDGFSADLVVADPDLNQEFTAACAKSGLAGNAKIWNTLLFRLRKRGELSHIKTVHQYSIPWRKCDKYIFASEIAWQMMLNDGLATSLDEILCDPVLAAQFDKTARRFAAGRYKPLDYRWAALKLRKEAKYARSRAAILTPPSRYNKKLPLEELDAASLRDKPGLYVISERTRRLYVGETLDLSSRLAHNRCQAWFSVSDSKPLYVQTLSMNPESVGRLTWQSCIVKHLKERPLLNSFELRSAS